MSSSAVVDVVDSKPPLQPKSLSESVSVETIANLAPADSTTSPYYSLHTLDALQQLFTSLQQQQAVMTLLADAEDATNWLDTSGRPCGMAVLKGVDADGQWLELQVTGVLQPLPTQVLAVVYLPGAVRTQWLLQAQWLPMQDGRWQLLSPWPALVLQHQRRRFPRVNFPLGQSYQASFQFGRRQCVLQLDDVSQGGVALRGTLQDTAMLFMGRKVPNVTLYLNDGLQVQVNVVVRSRRRYQSFLLGVQVLVGCSLEETSTEVQNVLQCITESRNT